MNILNHEVLTEKLQKKPNKSYIQKIQQYEGKRPMTLAKFKATGRKMQYKTYMSFSKLPAFEDRRSRQRLDLAQISP